MKEYANEAPRRGEIPALLEKAEQATARSRFGARADTSPCQRNAGGNRSLIISFSLGVSTFEQQCSPAAAINRDDYAVTWVLATPPHSMRNMTMTEDSTRMSTEYEYSCNAARSRRANRMNAGTEHGTRCSDLNEGRNGSNSCELLVLPYCTHTVQYTRTAYITCTVHSPVKYEYSTIRKYSTVQYVQYISFIIRYNQFNSMPRFYFGTVSNILK